MKLSNILFVAYFYPPTSTSGIPAVQRVARFIRYLSFKEAHILTIRPEYYSGGPLNSGLTTPIATETVHRVGVFDCFMWILRVRNLFKFKSNTKEVTVQPTPNHQKKSRYQQIKDSISYVMNFPDFGSPWLLPAITKGVKVIHKHDIDVIFATGMPWTSLMVGYFLKLLTGKKLIVDFRDPWVNNPFIAKGKFERALDRMWEKRIVKKADLVSVNTGSLWQDFKSRYPAAGQKIKCLPNGYDPKDYQSLERNSVPKHDKLVLSHTGFLYSKRDPRPLIDAIKLLYQQHPEVARQIVFQQVGNVNLPYDPEKLYTKNGLTDNLHFLEQRNHLECLRLMQRSDVLVIFQQGTHNQIPSKLYEYIALEKPILSIADRDSEFTDLVLREGFGVVFEEDRVDQIAEYLLNLYNLKLKDKQIPAHYSNKQRFDIRNVANELQRAIDTLLSTKQRSKG